MPIPDGYYAELPGIHAKLRAEAEQRLAETFTRCRAASVAVTRQIADGRPARMIVETAKAMGSDLIVMGTHGRSGVAHFVMGSVAEHVVRTAPCPVFTVGTPRALPICSQLRRAPRERSLPRTPLWARTLKLLPAGSSWRPRAVSRN